MPTAVWVHENLVSFVCSEEHGRASPQMPPETRPRSARGSQPLCPGATHSSDHGPLSAGPVPTRQLPRLPTGLVAFLRSWMNPLLGAIYKREDGLFLKCNSLWCKVLDFVLLCLRIAFPERRQASLSCVCFLAPKPGPLPPPRPCHSLTLAFDGARSRARGAQQVGSPLPGMSASQGHETSGATRRLG